MRWRRPAVNREEAERLDVVLDARTNASFSAADTVLLGPVPRVAAQVDHLDRVDPEPEPSAAFVRSLEITLMHQAHHAPRHQSLNSDIRHLRPVPAGDEASSQPLLARLPTIAAHSLSWFATAAVFALVAAFVTAAYLVSPRGGNHDPDRLAAIQASTPAPDQAGDEVTPLVIPCEVSPRGFGEVIELLQWRSPAGNGDLTGAVPPSAPNRVGMTGDGPPQLPDGSTVSPQDIDAVAATFGEYWGCISEQNTYGSLALLSDNEVVRQYYPGGIADNYRIAALNDPPADPALIERYDVGDPAGLTLFSFRQLSDGRIAAFLGLPSGFEYQGGSTPVPGARAGFVVFVASGDRWIIDEYVTTMG